MQSFYRGGDSVRIVRGVGEEEGGVLVLGFSIEDEIGFFLGGFIISGSGEHQAQFEAHLEILWLEFLAFDEEGYDPPEAALIGINQTKPGDGLGIEGLKLEYVHVLDFRFGVVSGAEI